MDQHTFNIVITIGVTVIALSFLFQSVMLMYISSGMKKLRNVATDLEAKVEPVINKVGPLIDQVQGTMATIKTTVDRVSVQAKETFDKVSIETRAVAAAVSASSHEITGLALRQAEQFSRTLDQTNSTLQRQVSDIDHLLDRTQRRIEDTTVEVQSTILDPIREVSAMLVGLKRLIESLFGRDRKPIDQAYQDEEMFI